MAVGMQGYDPLPRDHFKCGPVTGRPKRDRGRNRSQRRARKANR